MNPQNELTLFSYTSPVIPNNGLKMDGKRNEQNKVISISLSLKSRKDVAKDFGFAPKTDKSKIDEKMLELSDNLKANAVAEVMKAASSPDWTGGRISVRSSKSGVRRLNFSMVSVDRSGRTVSKEQLVAALSKLPEAEQMAIMEAAEKAAKQGGVNTPIEVETAQ